MRDLIKTLLAFAGQEEYISTPKAFIRFTGSIEAALMLSQLLFWTGKKPDGWIYKTDKMWMDEICLTQYAIRSARTRLEAMGLVETTVRKAEGNPTVHYRVNQIRLAELWQQFVDHPDSKNRSFDFAKTIIAKSQEPNVENASSITVYNNRESQQYLDRDVADAPSPAATEDVQDDQHYEGEVQQVTLAEAMGMPLDEVPKPKEKESRPKRASKARAGYHEGIAAFNEVAKAMGHPTMHPSFAGKAMNMLLDVADEEMLPQAELPSLIQECYRWRARDWDFEKYDLNLTTIAKNIGRWYKHIHSKPREVEAGASATPFKVQPLFVKPK